MGWIIRVHPDKIDGRGSSCYNLCQALNNKLFTAWPCSLLQIITKVKFQTERCSWPFSIRLDCSPCTDSYKAALLDVIYTFNLAWQMKLKAIKIGDCMIITTVTVIVIIFSSHLSMGAKFYFFLFFQLHSKQCSP